MPVLFKICKCTTHFDTKLRHEEKLVSLLASLPLPYKQHPFNPLRVYPIKEGQAPRFGNCIFYTSDCKHCNNGQVTAIMFETGSDKSTST